jgi:hypothetical protein
VNTPALFAIPAALLLCQCSSLPRPGSAHGTLASSAVAGDILRQAASQDGNRWRNASKVAVTFEGTWSHIAAKIQPTLTDPGYRILSTEIYETKTGRVTQVHQGPLGTKSVTDDPRTGTRVTRNGTPDKDAESIAAAAMVTDCYRLFLFGASWLVENGSDFRFLGQRRVDGTSCYLVSCVVAPGFGRSDLDHVIAWIGKDTGRLHRVQLSINGLASTRGADVDVTFRDFLTTARHGTWPLSFVETVRRPFPFQAHAWNITSLAVDGVTLR